MSLFAEIINTFDDPDVEKSRAKLAQIDNGNYKKYTSILESLFLVEQNKFDVANDLLSGAIRSAREQESWVLEYAALSAMMVCEVTQDKLFEAEQLGAQTETLSVMIERNEQPIDLTWLGINYFAKGLIFESKDNHDQAVENFENALEHFEKIELKHYNSKLYSKLGELFLQIGKYNVSLSYFHQHLLTNQDDPKESILPIYDSMATIHVEKGQYDIALYYLQSALNMVNNSDELSTDEIILKASLNQQIGRIYIHTGNLSLAIKYLEKSSTTFYDQKDQRQLGWATMLLGLTNHKMGLLEVAMGEYEKCVDIFEKLDDTLMVASNYRSIGEVHKLIGNYDRAIDYYQKNLALVKNTDNHSAIADSMNRIGKIHHLRQELHLALDYFQQSFSIYIRISEKFNSVDTLLNLIKLKLDLNSFDQAKFLLGILSEIKDQTQDRHTHLKHQIAKALLLKHKKRIIEKVEAQKIFLQISQETIIDHELSILAMLNLTDLLISELFMYQEKEVLTEILSYLDNLYEIAQEQRSFPLLVEVLIRRTKFALIEGDASKANELLEQAELVVFEKDLKHLVKDIENQKTLLIDNLSRWDELNRQNATIREKLLLADLDSFMVKMFSEEK